MREQPDGAALLAIAREVLRKALLPLLPPERAYEVLMIANAMSIAERQLKNGEQAEREECDALQELLGHEGDLAALNRDLGIKIRTGEMDNNTDAQRLLRRGVVQRVQESAPKALLPYGMA